MVRADHTAESEWVRSDQVGKRACSPAARAWLTRTCRLWFGQPGLLGPLQRSHRPHLSSNRALPTAQGELNRSSLASAAGAHASSSSTPASAPTRVRSRATRDSAQRRICHHLEAASIACDLRSASWSGIGTDWFVPQAEHAEAMTEPNTARSETPDRRPCPRRTSYSPAASIAHAFARSD